jgi:hypothetical protein
MMGVSPQLHNSLAAHLGPHSANELISLLAKPTDPTLQLAESVKSADREIVSLKQDLNSALIRIEHLERAAQSSPMSAAFEAVKSDVEASE